jgi:hypothetical protein
MNVCIKTSSHEYSITTQITSITNREADKDSNRAGMMAF